MRASILDGAKRSPEGQRFADAKLLSKAFIHSQKDSQLLLLIRPPGLPLRATFQVVSLSPLGSSACRTKFRSTTLERGVVLPPIHKKSAGGGSLIGLDEMEWSQTT